MLSMSQYLLFISVSVLLILALGPDVIFTITQGMSRGRKAGVMTAQGLALGNLVHTTAAALGISVIFRTSEIAFMVLKIFGAMYLFYLAFKLLRSGDSMISLDGSEAPRVRSRSLVARGFIMNVLNPKVALFFLAFLPQFTDPAAGNVTAQIFILGLTFIVLVGLIFGLCGYFAGLWLSKRPRFNRNMGYATALVYIGLGLKLLVARR